MSVESNRRPTTGLPPNLLACANVRSTAATTRLRVFLDLSLTLGLERTLELFAETRGPCDQSEAGAVDPTPVWLTQRTVVPPAIWPLLLYLKRRSLTEFATTDTEENAMAAAAIIGFRKPSAARGIAAVL